MLDRGAVIPAGRLPRGLIIACALTALILAGSVASGPAGGATRATKQRIGRSSSANWSGYVVDGAGATQVIGTWTEPAVTCAAGENSWSSPWVGIDGDTSNTVEQTGTDSDCKGGRPAYYAWYEMYPKRLVKLNMAIHPGDSVTGIVAYGGGSFLLRLTDATTRATFTTIQSAKKALRSSVEWIMEGPSHGLLSDFESVSFVGASATIDGQTAGLSSFARAQPFAVVKKRAGTVRAQPSPVTGNAFSVVWKGS